MATWLLCLGLIQVRPLEINAAIGKRANQASKSAKSILSWFITLELQNGLKKNRYG